VGPGRGGPPQRSRCATPASTGGPSHLADSIEKESRWTVDELFKAAAPLASRRLATHVGLSTHVVQLKWSETDERDVTSFC
jgi:hypothetical protein